MVDVNGGVIRDEQDTSRCTGGWRLAADECLTYSRCVHGGVHLPHILARNIIERDVNFVRRDAQRLEQFGNSRLSAKFAVRLVCAGREYGKTQE